MFSGKTQALLAWERKSLIAKKRVMIFKHVSDIRYTDSAKIISHSGITSSSEYVLHSSCLMKFYEIAADFDVILVDEGQFFPDIVEFSLKMLTETPHKHIVVSCLSGDYKQEPFEVVSRLISISDTVQHLKAICSLCGEDASFTKRIGSDTRQTLVGGAEMYKPRCRTCFTHPE